MIYQEQTAEWPIGTVRFVYESKSPDEHLVSNVRAACFSGDGVVVFETLEFGVAAFPGGTREPGEHWRQTLDRELLEEIGARARSFTVFGRVRFSTNSPTPYRPHLPHPVWQWIVGWADVDIVAEPSEVADGEHVLAVHLLDHADALNMLRDAGKMWEAEMLEAAIQDRARARG